MNTTEETRTIIRQYFSCSTLEKGMEAWLDLFADDAEVSDPPAQLWNEDESIIVRGKNRIREYFEWIHERFPSTQLVPFNEVVEGEWGVVEWTTRGMYGIEFNGVDVIHVVDGKIVENRVYFDLKEAMRKE